MQLYLLSMAFGMKQKAPPPPPPLEPSMIPMIAALAICWVLPVLLLIMQQQSQAAKAEALEEVSKRLRKKLVMRRPVVGGNWKCNPADPAKLEGLIANVNACSSSGCDIYICPSPLHVALVQGKLRNGAKVAPQNCNFSGCGAYTGEMAVDQMVAMGIEWCLIGHSERRGEFGLPTPGESPKLLATKLKYILDKGLKCVFCIGEPLSVRKQGISAVLSTCADQLVDILPYLDPDKVVIAYEPVWSIGTGVTASPAQAQETHAGIRAYIGQQTSDDVASRIRIQYGGSANAKNAGALSACPDVDGFLVGSASLKPEFSEIIDAVAKAKAFSML